MHMSHYSKASCVYQHLRRRHRHVEIQYIMKLYRVEVVYQRPSQLRKNTVQMASFCSSERERISSRLLYSRKIMMMCRRQFSVFDTIVALTE